jgi:DNA mismatch repair protein MutS
MDRGYGGTSASFALLVPPGRDRDAYDDRAHAADLHLDQIAEHLTHERADAEMLTTAFFQRTRDVETVRYRHDVFKDLEDPGVWQALRAFCESIADVLSHLSQAHGMRVLDQRRAWTLDGAAIYCGAVRTLTAALDDAPLRSRGLQGFRRYLAAYTGSDAFRTLECETAACTKALEAITYCVHIDGGKVTVLRSAGEPDYSEEVEQLFERFRQGAVRSYLVEYRIWPGMTRIGAQILERVARLFPDEFARLASYFENHKGFLDEDVHRFYRELQFYVSYRDLVDPLRAAGLPFCYPEVDATLKEERGEETFDLALATVLVPEGGQVVTNDFRLEQGERIFVVSGPNQGGKTTFARTFGQLHHLSALGVMVPGRRARVFLCDRIFTHFEREEDVSLQTGKLEADLLAMQHTLQTATPESVVVMNEVFSSTSLADARFLGKEAMRRLIELGCLAVYVTFVDELASFAPCVVSMISTVVPDDPATRTFKVVRGPANGLAYALALAERYRLTYPQLLERIP